MCGLFVVIKVFMWVYILIGLIVVLDQISKILVKLYLPSSAGVSVIPRLLSLRYHENSGAAWGMLADHRWVFMLISTIAILAILAYLVFVHVRKIKTDALFCVALAFFCGGGIGNMIDRIYLGYVIDFLRFDFIDFPIFNVADSFISIGACLMVLYLIIETVKDLKNKKKSNIGDRKNGSA